MSPIAKIARILAGRIHRRQIAFEFPLDMLAQGRAALPALPDGFELRQPPDAGDYDAIATLLQQEPGFGTWTRARLQSEVFDRLAHPLAATLILRDGVPAASGFATDASTRHRKVAHGMYLYVAPAYRSRTNLAPFITFCTLGHCIDAGYQQVIAYTDPERLSALLLYLSIGVRPIRDTISSFWQWRRIERRLAPALQRLARTGRKRATP